MVELPLPSFTILPSTPEPAGREAAAGAAAAVTSNVIVLPLTVMLLPPRPVADTVAAKAFEAAPEVLASTVAAVMTVGVVLLFCSAPNEVEPPTPPIRAEDVAAVVPPAAPVYSTLLLAVAVL